MTSLTTLLSWLYDALYIALYNATIKGSLVIVLVALFLWLAGSRIDPRWRHLLWLIVLVRLIVPVAPSSSWSLFNLLPSRANAPTARPAVWTIGSIEVNHSLPRSAERVPESRWPDRSRWLVAIWLSGVVLLALRTLIASLRLNVRVAHASRNQQPLGVLLEVLEDAKRQLGIRQKVRVVECAAVKAPALHGLLRPALLVPPTLAATFSREQLRHVVLHELWHLRRLDVAVSWLLSAVQTLHWFNPFVWFAASRIKEEREIACDELALSCLEEDERHDYGTTILKLLERFRATTPVPALVGIVNHKQKMKRRLTMIASFRNRTRFSILFLVTVALLGLTGLTDAVGGERIMKRIHKKGHESFERLETRITFDLTDATFGELLSTIAAKGGVVINQGPLLATLPVQQARFTVHAENVPAHVVLMETLMPFELAPSPDANGVVIGKADHIRMRHSDHADTHEDGEKHKVMIRRHAEPGSSSAGEPGEKMTIEREMITTNGSPEEAESAMRELDGEAAPGTADERVFVLRSPGGPTFSDDGKLHGDLKLQFSEDGVKSTGKLVFDITAPPK